MKLRIQGQSLRLRLKKSEVDHFAENGTCSEILKFPDGKTLIYRLEQFDGEEVMATWDASGITVYVPASTAHKWTQTERVGFRGKSPVEADLSLDILVEKDFKCLTGEDSGEDFYDHPYQKHSS